MIDNSIKESPNVVVGLYPTLMETFKLPPPKFYMISHVKNKSSGVQIPFKASYLSYPWNLPNPHDENSTGTTKPISATKVTYKVIQEITMEKKLQTFETEESNHYSSSIWDIGLLTESDPLDSTFPTDESIMEAMNMMEKP